MFMITVAEVSMDVASECNALLLVSKIHHDFKVHWNFCKGKGFCTSQVWRPLVT